MEHIKSDPTAEAAAKAAVPPSQAPGDPAAEAQAHADRRNAAHARRLTDPSAKDGTQSRG